MRVPLLDHVRALLAEKDLRDRQRYDAQIKAVETAMAAQQTAMRAALDAADRATDRAMAAAEKAVTKAELAADKRFELLNELRMGVATKAELEALEKIVGVLAAEVSALRQSDRKDEMSKATRLTIIGLLIAAASVVIALVVSR